VATCLIGAGSNAGDRRAAIELAIKELREQPATSVIRASRFYHTLPVGGPADQTEFLNAAFLIATALPPETLLQRLQAIEQLAGRTPGPRWGPRTLDLDLLLYEDLQFESAKLSVPHPRMVFRRFVLEAAVNIAPNIVHPVAQMTLQQLLDHLNLAPNYVAIAGASSGERSRLVQRVCSQSDVRPIYSPVEQFDDSSSPALAAQIEFTDRRIQLLQPIRSHPEQVWISDFWLDESLVSLESLLSELDMQAVATAWEQQSKTAVIPKLIVLLDRRDSGTKPPQTALCQLASSRGVPPMFKLDAAAVDWNVEEIVAAVQAMQ